MFSNNLLMAAAGGGGGYVIEGSGLFDGDSGYANLTTGASGTPKKGTIHVEFKRSKLGTLQYLVAAAATGPVDNAYISFTTADTIRIVWQDSADTTKIDWTSTQVFRDVAATGIITVTWNTDTASPTFQVFYNNAEITAWTKTTDSLAQDDVSSFGASGTDVVIGAIGISHTGFFDGYISRAIYLDGVVVTDQSNFVSASDDGYVEIIDNTGTYNAEGWKVEGGTDMNAGTDSSGNGNNFSVTATITATNDSPTNDADNDYGNYCTLDPLQPTPWYTLSKGNLYGGFAYGPTNVRATLGTLPFPKTGKFYFEMEETIGSAAYAGVVALDGTQTSDNILTTPSSGSTNKYCMDGGNYYEDGTGTSSGLTFAQGDVMGVAIDMGTGEMWFSQNNVWQSGSPSSGTSPTLTIPAGELAFPILPFCGSGSNTHYQTWDFGQNGFAYTPPTDFKALATQNFPTPDIPTSTEHHQVELVSHDGTSTAFTCNWDADTYDTLFIIKNRDSVEAWYLIDGLNGYNKYTQIQTTTQQTDANVISVSGTTCTLGSTLASAAYLVECHKAGLSASRATNSGGTNTTTTSYNSTSKFVIGTYPTGASPSGGDTIEHGMAAAPEFMHFHKLGADGTVVVWHKNAGGNTGGMGLDNDGGFDVSANYWNDTSPDATTVTLGASTAHNAASENFVFYGWIGVEGYSEFTSFIGPGASEPFPMVNLGFSPGSFWWKTANKVEEWYSLQKVIQDYNPKSEYLIISATDAETTLIQWDFLSNGARERATGGHMGQPGKITLVMTWGGTPIQGPAPSTSTSQGRAR